ncbi:MAG: S9 family peptidase [Candidatus Brocadiae bacterium]|nr:S9 family peptidase [Candidatus Brocadiia bacterium]
MPSPLLPSDLFHILQPSSCRLSPDGTRAIVAASRPDREQLKNTTHLWMVDVAGDAEPRAFTQGKGSETNPRWSPDGRTIAFVSARGGRAELWLIPADGGEAAPLTKLAGSVGDFAWSPDGRSIAFIWTARDAEAVRREEKKKRGEPGTDAPAVRAISRLFYKLDGAGFLPGERSHLWVVNVKSGKTRQLVKDNRWEESGPAWSADGRSIYFLSNREPDPDRNDGRSDIWTVPAKGGRIRKIRKFAGPAHNLSVSPDGRWIAFLGQPDPDARWNSVHTKLWVIPSAGGRPVELSRGLDRSCGNSAISDTFGIPATSGPFWSPDSSEVAFVIVNEGSAEIWKSSLATRKPEPLVRRPGVLIEGDLDWTRRRAVASFSDVSNPGEIRVLSWEGDPAADEIRTQFNSSWLRRRTLAKPRELWCLSKDGADVQGWILMPPVRRAGKRCPAVLYIHGGPATQYSKAFMHEFQVLAARGFAVLYCNPRCSTGYSQRHLNACQGAWGTKDFEDLMAFTDACLKAEPGIDPRRLGVAGGSYGGFMTNWIVGHTRRFRAAVSSRSISNFLSFVGSSDFGYLWPKGFWGDDNAWSNPKKYLAMSPLSSLHRMNTPMLIEHQEEDHRCPMEQAEQLWAALKWKGVPVEFARYPQEPHGMSRGGRPDRRIDRLERIEKWFSKWLT